VLRAAVLALAPLLAGACVARPAARHADTAGAIQRARDEGKRQLFAWNELGPAVFAKAKAEGRLVLLHGAASWCHFCHAMEQITYRDPTVGGIVRDRFVAVRADIDAHPDLAERYGDWGWPATIVLDGDAREVGKLRGYYPPGEMKGVLQRLLGGERMLGATEAPDVPPPVSALGWIAAFAALEMDGYHDDDLGGWGMRQKAPMPQNAEFELRRAAHGDGKALARAVKALDAQRALLDPVWGGIYQYSVGGTWKAPHYEKLMTYQAQNLEAAALVYRATGEARFLADARGIAGYVTGFLTAPNGAFWVSQDADVGGHDEGAAIVPGDTYYRLPDAGRRRIGIPRVDKSVFPFENGLAIAAFAILDEAERARGAAASPLKLRLRAEVALAALGPRIDDEGRVRRRDDPSAPRYLADAASLGRAAVVLARTAPDRAGKAKYRALAERIAKRMLTDFGDAASAGLFDATETPGATGVFATRVQPFPPNALAARFLAELAMLTGDVAWRERSRSLLAAIGSPRRLRDQGRMVGSYLLALDDAGAFPWSK